MGRVGIVSAMLALVLLCGMRPAQAQREGKLKEERPVGRIAFARGEIPVYADKDVSQEPLFLCYRGQMLFSLSKNEEWARVALGDDRYTSPIGFCRPEFLTFGRLISRKEALNKALEIPDGTPNPWITLIVESSKTGNSGILPPPVEEPLEEIDEQPLVKVTNDTAKILYVFLSGPSTRRLTIAAAQTAELRVPPGDYTVTANSAAPGVIPYTGPWELKAGYIHSSSFFISTTRGRGLPLPVTKPMRIPRPRFGPPAGS